MTTPGVLIPENEQFAVPPVDGSPDHTAPPAQPDPVFSAARIEGPVLVALAGLGLGLAADLLFNGQPGGISIPIFFALLLAGVGGLMLSEGAVTNRRAWWLAAPLLAFAVCSMVLANPFLRFLNVSLAALLAILIVDRLRGGRLIDLTLWGYAKSLMLAGLGMIALPVSVTLRAAQGMKGSDDATKKLALRILTGLIITLPLLALFTGLLAAADLIFEQAVTQALGWFNLPNLFGHAMLTLLLTWPVMGLLAFAISRRMDEEDGSERVPDADRMNVRFLGMVESGIVLFSIDVLFALFVVIQFRVLFGGERFLASRGLTYAEYARRGFFELVFVAGLVLTVILVLEFLAKRETPRAQTVFITGVAIMIAMTLIMIASAFTRMSLYEQAYGFTRLRLYTHVFMVWLGVLLSTVLVLILTRRTRQVAGSMLLAAMGCILALNVINPDAFIVAHNIDRYERGEELDVHYLGSLSEDAVPGLLALYKDGLPVYEEDTLGGYLRRFQFRAAYRADTSGWPAYHISHTRADRLLRPYAEELEGYEWPSYRYDGISPDLYEESQSR